MRLVSEPGGRPSVASAPRGRRVLGVLAITQIVSWGSLYYAFGILAPAVAHDLGLRSELVYGAYSLSLLIAGLAAAPVGAIIDRHGGRLVMSIGSVLAALGVYLLSQAASIASLYGAWALIGLAMAATLYEAAFATINRHHGDGARQAMSTLTLFAGFASTIFWPLTMQLSTELGWRATYAAYAAIQLGLCLPLHLLLHSAPAAPSSNTPSTPKRSSHTLAQALRHPAFWSLGAAFSLNALVFSTLSVHLIPLLTKMGHPLEFAVFGAALIGPTQVAGRMLERGAAHRVSPAVIGKLTFSGLPAALAVLVLFGAERWALAAFCVMYGASNGVLTIVRATLPRALFGPENYGAISGTLAGPAMFAKAAGPVAAAWVLGQGASAAGMTSLLLMLSMMSLLLFGMAMRSAAANQP